MNIDSPKKELERVETEEPRHIITYTPDCSESVKSALKQYAELIDTNQAFEDNYCVVVADLEVDKLSLSFFKENRAIYKEIKSLVQWDIKNDEDNIIGCLLTETLLVACALKHPELESTIKDTLDVVVKYARRINNSEEMWITDESPFAIEYLSLVATIYPKYGYLLASFMVPYWDDEHMPEQLDVLSDWAAKVGVTDDTIKAFCYCDNSSARASMVGYQEYAIDNNGFEHISFSLLPYLRESEENYLNFKNILVKRFEDMPYLKPYESAVEKPIESMVLDMMSPEHTCNFRDDDFDVDEYFTNTFIKNSADVEILELKTFVEDKLGRSILEHPNKLDNSIDDNTDDNNQQSIFPLQDWQDFIIQGLDNGQEIWDYVNEGKNSVVLDSIPKINLYLESKKVNYALYKLFDEESYNNLSLWENFSDILSPLYKEFQQWSRHNNINYRIYDEIFLRLLDVIFLIYDKSPFTEQVKRLITHKFELCSVKVFESRYKVDWFNQLQSELGERRSSVLRQNVENTLELINNNRQQAVEILPKKLFIIEDKQSVDEADIMVLSAVIALNDQTNGHSDELTKSAITYLEHYNKLALWNDLKSDLDIPQQYIIHAIENGTGHFPEDEITQYENKKDNLTLLDEYISNNGFVIQNGKKLSLELSENVIRKILNLYIKTKVDDEISAKQKNINWLRGFSDNTQKLLYVAHLAQQIDTLKNNVISTFVLTFAFEIAPVRTVHLLAKAYKIDEYRIDTPNKIATYLDMFTKQGLSDVGYWAYFLQEFYSHYDDEEGDKFYKEILKEWIKSDQVVTTPNSLSPLQQTGSTILQGYKQISRKAQQIISKHGSKPRPSEHRVEIALGYELISRRGQQAIVQHAAELFPSVDLTDKEDALLLGRVERILEGKFAVPNSYEYFKNRLQGEGEKVEFIRRAKWGKSPELIQQIIHEIVVDKPDNIPPENCEEDERYIVLQKQAGKLVPLVGADLIWMIQCNENNKGMARTAAIVIDESCPQENLNELLELCQNKQYKQFIINKCIEFLKGEIPYSDAVLLCKYGINDYNFEKSQIRNYNDVNVYDSLINVSKPLQQRLLQMFALGSYETLIDIGSELDLDDSVYLDLLLNADVDRESIFKCFSSNDLVETLARKINISAFIPSLKIAEQVAVLSAIAKLPYYHHVILSNRHHDSAKIKAHVKSLITQYNINELPNNEYEIVDFGLYDMQGDPSKSEKTGRTTVSEPFCSNHTDTIKAELGQFFGFRFTATNPEDSTVLFHHVVIKHPIDNVIRHKDSLIMQWKQNGYSNSNIFLGWHFETPEELIAGEYEFEAYDNDWKLIAKKTITVVA